MSRDETRADMATVRDRVDVAVWQEIAEAEDDEDLDLTLPPAEWYHLFPRIECPISIRRSLLALTPVDRLPAGIDANHGSVKLSDGRAHVSPARHLSWAVCDFVGVDLPPVVFAGTHWVSGAFTNPGQRGDADGWRLDTWQQDFDGTAAKIAEWHDAGLTVVFGGDLNTPEGHLPDLHPDIVWVVNDGGYDKLAIIPAPGGTVIAVDDVARVPLNSDHDLRAMSARATL